MIIPFPVKKQGTLAKTIRCPYHGGDSLSCFVNYLLDRFHCLDCRETGSIEKLRNKLAETPPSSA